MATEGNVIRDERLDTHDDGGDDEVCFRAVGAGA